MFKNLEDKQIDILTMGFLSHLPIGHFCISLTTMVFVETSAFVLQASEFHIVMSVMISA
jgi:hypothetical protein